MRPSTEKVLASSVKKYTTSKTNKIKNLPMKFIEAINHMDSSESVSEESIKEEPKKPRWYDCRPRLIINRYYRKNFSIKNHKEEIFTLKKIDMKNIWRSIIMKCIHNAALSKNFKKSLIHSDIPNCDKRDNICFGGVKKIIKSWRLNFMKI